MFKCPSCDALGNNEDDALKVCDDKAVDQGCLEQYPVCEATLTKTGAIVKVLRGCSTKKRYEAAKKKCLRAFVGCPQMAYCTESGCQATLPAMQKGNHFKKTNLYKFTLNMHVRLVIFCNYTTAE